jgi:integrase
MVNLTQNGDYWRARWTDSLGRRQTKNVGKVSEMSLREAKKLAAAFQTDQTKNAGRYTLATWREKYVDLREGQVSEETIRLHNAAFDDLDRYFGSDTRIAKIERMHAAEFRSSLSKRVKESTVCGIVARVKVIFSHAVDMEIIEANPFERLVSTNGDIDKQWAQIDHATLAKIIEACPNDAWRMAFALARWAGLRINEIRSLQWSNINWDTRIITIQHAGRITTKKRTRTCPIRPELFEMLAEHFERADAGELGPAMIPVNNVYKIVPGILENAGCAGYSKPFHTLRKNCESEWAAKFPILDVTSWLGNSPTVAAKHYVRSTEETLAGVTGIGPKVVQEKVVQTS